jgi:hypothetical protein
MKSAQDTVPLPKGLQETKNKLIHIKIYSLVTMVYSYNYHCSGIIHLLVFYLKHDGSETGFCLRLHAESNPAWRQRHQLVRT